MKIKFITILLGLFLLASAAFAAPFNANAKTKRIPAGTKFKLELLAPLSTTQGAGKDFSAVLITDQTADSDVILPSGSLVRGIVKNVTPAKRFSKGAILYLDFDHVVTPNGRQLPLSLSVVGRSDMTYDGGITTTKGYGDAVKKNWERTKEITSNCVDWGSDVANDGAVKYVTVPVGAIGGAIGGGAYFVWDSIADMIRKGEDVYIKTGEVLEVILSEPIDVPVI
ncbi:hypothetical protein IAC76_09060 [Spirochaetes bacterium]|uniref:Uncharacterized protein n=1 Tax=Candidatus Scatousia excrementipullorum TaxID=2840936 RepID=A0A9D9DP68_9BACT|nr:hypothetical protein [Candidatus Scatousia excrementipullorum]